MKDKKIEIKRIRTSFEKKIERINKFFELKGKIEKKNQINK
jgi:hypothetical protein